MGIEKIKKTPAKLKLSKAEINKIRKYETDYRKGKITSIDVAAATGRSRATINAIYNGSFFTKRNVIEEVEGFFNIDKYAAETSTL